MTARYQILQAGGVFDYVTRSIVPPDRSSAGWIKYQEWLTAGGIPLPPDSIGLDDLETSKIKRCEEINSYAAGLRNKIIAGRSIGEVGGWAAKLIDALAVANGQASPFASFMPAIQSAFGLSRAPNSLMDAMAMRRGITESEYVAKVIRDGGLFFIAEISLDPIRGKHCDAIESMTDVRDIVTYDWSVGWPSI